MTHKELDDLFRANSDRGDFTPHQEEWEAMTSLLDADDRKIRNQKILSSLWILVFVALIAGGIWGTIYYTDRAADPASQTDPVEYAQEANENPLNSDEEELTASGSEGFNLTTNSTNERQNEVIDRNYDLQRQNETLAAQTSNRPSSYLSASAKTIALKALEPSVLKFESAKAVEPNVFESTLDVADNSMQKLEAVGSETALITPATSRNNQQDHFTRDQTDLNSVVTSAQKSSYASDKLSSLSYPRLSLFDLVSPDLSVAVKEAMPPHVVQSDLANKFSFGLIASTERITVDFNGDGQYGYSLGAGARLKMSERLGFGVSFNYSSKKYNAAASSYKSSSEDHWVGDLPAHQTNGDVRSLDIPLYADFLLLGSDQNSLYGFSGLNATYILRERLHHFYREAIPGQTHQWENTSHGRLGLSIQLGVGYRIVSKRLPAIRVGPYVQVPIIGVGHGNVQLYTGGLNLSLGL